MKMTGSYEIAADRETVWAALNDPEILRECIPGCDSLEMTAENELTAAVTAKVASRPSSPVSLNSRISILPNPIESRGLARGARPASPRVAPM